jgi:nitroreductase
MSSADTLYSILSTTRSIRRISTDPINPEVLNRVLQAAVWAPSGGNRQPWRIIAVRDRAKKQQLSDIYTQEWTKYVELNMTRVAGQPDSVVEQVRRGLAIGTHLAENLADVPVVAMFVHDPREIFVTDANLGRTSVVGGASLYPAVQNLLLAARAEGLGGVLTTLISSREPEVRTVLELPEPWGVYAMVPLGHPVGNHGPLRRAPLESMVKFDKWSE